MDKGTETTLVRQAKHGDVAAFQTLFEAYKDPIFRLVFGRLRDRQHAEDETLWIFVKAWKGLSTFGERSTFSTWLVTIACNHCRNVVRARSRDVASTPISALWPEDRSPAADDDIAAWILGADTQTNPEDILVQKELGQVIQQAVEELAPHERDAFVLANLEGKSESEGSRLMGCSIPQFRGYKFRGQEKVWRRVTSYRKDDTSTT